MFCTIGVEIPELRLRNSSNPDRISTLDYLHYFVLVDPIPNANRKVDVVIHVRDEMVPPHRMYVRVIVPRVVNRAAQGTATARLVWPFSVEHIFAKNIEELIRPPRYSRTLHTSTLFHDVGIATILIRQHDRKHRVRRTRAILSPLTP